MSTVSVRYIVDDVDAAIEFYREHLGFIDARLEQPKPEITRGIEPENSLARRRLDAPDPQQFLDQRAQNRRANAHDETAGANVVVHEEDTASAIRTLRRNAACSTSQL